MKVTKNVSGMAPGNGVTLLRLLSSKAVMLFFAVFLALGSAGAQNINDWVGSRNLVNGNIAIERLKQSARTIMQNAQQQQPSQQSTSVANGQAMDLQFVLRVAEEIAANNRTAKDAINVVATSYATSGMPTTEIARATQIVISILS
jgi:hypothetical protein